jgi:hypothetical protein
MPMALAHLHPEGQLQSAMLLLFLFSPVRHAGYIHQNRPSAFFS